MAERVLDPFQTDAVARVLDEWTRVRSTLIVCATGLGKTRIASEIFRLRAPVGRSLMIAHREELITQAARAIREDAGLSVEIEMADQKATVHGESLYPASDVVIASVPTLHTGRLLRWPRNSFSTIVVDEAHHATAVSWRNVTEHFHAASLVGLTATPDRSDEVGLRNVFASCAFEYGIRDGIRDGYLAPIRMLRVDCADLDISEIKTVAGDLSAGELDQALSTDKVLHQIASPLVKLAENRPTLVFTAGVEQAHRLSGVLAGYTDPEKVIALDGKTPRDFRRQMIEEFKAGKIQFLINMGLFLEGFDAPATSCVAMARPTKSRALYTQAVGRGTRGGALRPVAGKTDCLVLDFVGQSGKHKLVNSLDVLAGKDIVDDRIRKLVEKKTGKGMDLEGALTAAEHEIEKRDKAAAERKRAKVQADAAFRATQVDPFGSESKEARDPAQLDLSELGMRTIPDNGGDRASDKQLEFIRKMGLTLKRENTSKGQAGMLCQQLMLRMKRNQCTIGQARILRKYGARLNLTRPQAKQALDEIAKDGWKHISKNPDLWEKWGPRE